MYPSKILRILPSLILAPFILVGTPAVAETEAEELSPFQVVHRDLARESARRAMTYDVPVVMEVPEPSGEFDKEEVRRLVNRTVDVGRAWQDDETRRVTLGGPHFSVSGTFEAVDLSTASGITGTLFTPPDTMGAVGPTQFVTAQNGTYRFHDKLTGAPDLSLDVAAEAFWVAAVDPNANGGGDARVRFDRINDIWIIIAFEIGPGNSTIDNRLLIALSDGPTITGATVWTQYYITPKDTVGGSGDSACFADYPMLGVDINAIYLGANMFPNGTPCGGGSSFGGTNTTVWVIPRGQLPMGGGNASSITTAFADMIDNGPIWSPMPVDNVDPGATTGYVIGHDVGSDTTLVLAKIANPGGAPGTPTITFHPITISNKNDGYGTGVPYPGVPSPNGTTLWGLDPLGFRPLGGAHVRSGRLWLSMTSSVDGPTGTLQLFPATGDRHSVVFFEINVATNALIQDGNVHDQTTARGTDPLHVYMGSIMVNGQGHAVVGATGNNTSTIAPSAVWASRLASDPLGQFSEPAIYFAGTNTGDMRHSFETLARDTRWGDYSMVTVDPCDDMTFYAIQQYQDTPAVATGGNWGVAVARILAPAPTFATASPTSVSAVPSATVTITGTGFYSPPTSGMSACRKDITASSTYPSLSVNSVTYVSPTEIMIDFNASGAASGNATVTITNPDGQTVDFELTITAPIFTDGFESGNTAAWSNAVL